MQVFVNEHIHPNARKILEDQFDVVDHFNEPEKIVAIIVRAFDATAEVMDRCPNLRVIGKYGVGYNTIDVEAAKERGIIVFNTPTANTNSVAELIVGLVLDICRNITLAHQKSRDGAFQKIAPVSMTGMEITGKTLGLIGTGNIARQAAKILRDGFGMKVVGYDPFVDRATMLEMGYEKCDTVEEVLKVADVVRYGGK